MSLQLTEALEAQMIKSKEKGIKAKLRQIWIHDLRHLDGTLKNIQGWQYCGRIKPARKFFKYFTMRIYYQLLPGKKIAEVDKLDDQYFRDRTGAKD